MASFRSNCANLLEWATACRRRKTALAQPPAVDYVGSAVSCLVPKSSENRDTSEMCSAWTERAPRMTSEVFAIPYFADILGAACCEPYLLTRLSMTRRSLHNDISSADFAGRRTKELMKCGISGIQGCMTLEQIAVGMAVAKMCESPSKNRLYFPYGGGTDVVRSTRPLLAGAAALAERHPQLRIHADGHAGAGAPTSIAKMCSLSRCKVVKRELMARGLCSERLTSTGWGKKVAMVDPETEDHLWARAELFFRLGAKEFPCRQDYYDAVPESLRPRAEEPEEGEQQEASSPDEEPQGARLFGGRQMIPISAVLAHLRGQRDRAGEDEDEEESDEEESDDQADEHDDASERAGGSGEAARERL
ncbi:unnamed protein product [Polarella glacialis]|uniref:Uncharacterized protein n=1 Tax=Polarella glacialis TaxID=89957 RepID=A0A813FBJ3_POLGL|nr:unnamed protein product [Polarella glacialis]CAE8625036.1 unnamed protein product [Polarella glacialis]